MRLFGGPDPVGFELRAGSRTRQKRNQGFCWGRDVVPMPKRVSCRQLELLRERSGYSNAAGLENFADLRNADIKLFFEHQTHGFDAVFSDCGFSQNVVFYTQ